MAKLMGGVSRQAYAATLPPQRFYCLLDELPLHLIPRGAGSRLPDGAGEHSSWWLNPECTFSKDAQLPDELSTVKDLVSGFALQGTVAWVRDAATGSTRPFWLGPRLDEAVRSLQSGRETVQTLPRDVRTWLRCSGILTCERTATRRLSDKIGRSAELFRNKGYAPLPDLIHPFHVAALRRYYRYLIRTGAIHLGDGQSALRYVAYNEPVARFFHHQIAATLSAIAGEPLKPSYVYLASYRGGADLQKHTDREQCEFSVTLCLDFSPEPALQTSWPIQLETPSGRVSVYQALGDGLAYRGTRLPHYRDVLPRNQTSTSIFFHYVRTDFSGSLS